MSYVLATPEMVAAAANNLAQIGSTLSAANAAALAPTTGVLAAGADEVSAAVASLFSGHAQAYQTLGTQAAAFHERFIQALSTAAGAYGSAEAANASPLQQALNVINAPTQTLLGRPLIGNGTNGAPGTGQAGGPGGLLYGNGGNGGSGGVGQAGGAGGSAGLIGIGGPGGVLLGLDGFTAPASTSPLHTLQQDVINMVNDPFQTLTGRPLIGNGANGTPGTGADGGAGGWLFGNGGNGGGLGPLQI